MSALVSLPNLSLTRKPLQHLHGTGVKKKLDIWVSAILFCSLTKSTRGDYELNVVVQVRLARPNDLQASQAQFIEQENFTVFLLELEENSPL